MFLSPGNLAVSRLPVTSHPLTGNLGYIGDLKTPATGFAKYNGNFKRAICYDEKDKNWDKLIGFIKDKFVPIDGKKVPVLDIIGFNK